MRKASEWQARHIAALAKEATATRPEWATVALVADLRRVRGDLALAGKWASVRAVEEAINRIEEAERDMNHKTTPVEREQAVEVAAKAMALHDDYDGCFVRVEEWEALEQWERDAQPQERPDSDYEDAEWWRVRARAGLDALGVLSADQKRHGPVADWKDDHANASQKALEHYLVESIIAEFAGNMKTDPEKGLFAYGIRKVALYTAQVARAQALGFDPELLRMTPTEANRELVRLAAEEADRGTRD